MSEAKPVPRSNLIVTLKRGSRFLIGENIDVEVVDSRPGRQRLRIHAPITVKVTKLPAREEK